MASMESKKSRKKSAPYTEDTLKKALRAIRENKVSVRQACREFGIPKSTILDRIHGKTTDSIKKRGPDPVIGTTGEKKIVEWLINISKCGFPVKKQELLDSVQKIIKDASIPNNFKNDRPGQTWYTSFLKRNPEISCRSAEGINRARAQVSEESIRSWFKRLETYLDEINQKDILNRPKSIFNGDESGFLLCPKTGKVLGPRGFRNLYQVKQGNEKDNLTVLVTFNANGDVCPPCVVFPYVRPPRAVVESMPPNWCLGRSESGWMRGDVFFEYVTNEFNNWLEQNNIQKPVLLLVDGHKSHMSLMLSAICEEMQIILYALPPNTTHILQPADVSVFAPLKTSWKNTVRKFLMKPENLNSSVTKMNFCKLCAETLQDTNLVTCIRNGFKRCGLYPFDPNAPDYSKCVFNTLENIRLGKTHTQKEIGRADVTTTKKVLKQIKSALKGQNVNLKVIMKELNTLKNTLPVETNISEVTIDTESDCTNSTMHQVSVDALPMPSNSASIDLSVSMQKAAETPQIPHNVELGSVVNKTVQEPLNIDENCNSLSSLHIAGSYLEVGSIVSLDDILVTPLEVTENMPEENLQSALVPGDISIKENAGSLSTVNKEEPTSSCILSSAIEKESTLHNVLAIPETPSQAKTENQIVSLPIIISSTPISTQTQATFQNPEAFSSIVLQEDGQNINSFNISKENIRSKTLETPPSTSKQNLYISNPESKTEPILLDPFGRHLYLPNQPIKAIKSAKNKTPAAISSAAWREHYNMRETLKNLKQEENRKRKLERTKKQQLAKILKESNCKQKQGTKVKARQRNLQNLNFRLKALRGINKENDGTPSASAGKIACSVCHDDLISDVEEDEDKNIGCDVCPRWYHLKCTEFQGLAYLVVKDKPYKCNHCV